MDHETIHYAVFFFDKGKIVKEMLWTEFEAVLDNVVGLTQFENREIQSVFVKINSQLKVTACVFFLIRFGEGGRADPTWNIPLQQLSDAATRGPDLGAGPIKLACFSQCPAAWHKQSMWDPDLDARPNHFDVIREAARRNRMNLVFVEAPAPAAAQGAVSPAVNVEALRQQIRQEERERAEGAIKEAKLRMATLVNQHKQEIEDVHRSYLRDLRDDHESLRKMRESLEHAEARARKFEASLDEQVAEMERMRHEFVAAAGQKSGADAEALRALEHRFEVEWKARLEAETRDLREALETKDVELTYRDEQMASLRDEVASLHQEKQRMLRDGAGNLLDKLEKGGISFVAWGPALGHINIPLAEMGQYLDSPEAYFARKSDIPLDIYEAWMAHHSFPVCQADVGGGDICGEPIDRVESPALFLPGRSDCCPQHQQRALAASA